MCERGDSAKEVDAMAAIAIVSLSKAVGMFNHPIFYQEASFMAVESTYIRQNRASKPLKGLILRLVGAEVAEFADGFQ